MRRIGICQKCGKNTLVQDHHWKGYSKDHKDDVVPYCQSCDLKAHAKAHKEGRCKLNHDETNKKSSYSYARRIFKTKKLSSNTLMPYISLFEQIRFNINTNHITTWSGFIAKPPGKLFYINVE